MQCLLCNFKFSSVNIGKKHYIDYHEVDESSPYFLDLFEPDAVEKACLICSVKSSTCRLKKNHMFLYHYGKQSGGSRQRLTDLPLNILKRGQITVNFDQHKDYYDFHSTDMIDVFLKMVYQAFRSRNHIYKFQGYFEIINQQRGTEIILEDKRIWLTNV